MVDNATELGMAANLAGSQTIEQKSVIHRFNDKS